ncbi:MAG: hypothetical protein ACOYYI_10605 [Chloroflexota bacterium]
MKKSKGCFLTSGILLLLLLCGGAAAWFFLSSNSQATRSFVQIRTPQSGIVTDLNEELPLMVYAEASRPVLRLEVYADGALIAAANGQTNTLTLAQPWTVSTPGRHVLVARAFFAEDDFADSQVVFVDTADLSGVPVQVTVDDLPRGEGVTEIRMSDLASAAGTTPEEIARLNPSLPAAPDAVIPPGTPLSLPRRSDPPPASPPPAVPPPALGAPGSPAPSPDSPHFDGETHSCSQVALRWTSTEFETGYRIYRLAPGEDHMSLLAELPVSTNTYTDTPITRVGTYRYFLAPLWRGGEGITSMLDIAIGPECSPSGTDATTSLRLLLLSLTTQEAYDGVYCYVSVNGSRYERQPAEPGLLHPTSGDLYYELPLQLPSRGVYSLTVPSDGLVRLDGECWGRRGVQSVRIGRFSGSHARSEWDGRDLTSEVLAFEPQQLASANGIPLGAGGASFVRYRIQPAGSRFDLGNIAPGALQVVYLNIPPLLDSLEGTDTTIPAPTNVRVRNLLSDCEPLPTTDPNVGTSVCDSEIIRSLEWDWRGNSFYTEADITGWRVNVSFINDEFRPGLASQPGPVVQMGRLNESNAGRRAPMPVIPSNYACSATVRITVTALTNRGNSLPSQPLDIVQPRCSQIGNINITIQSLTVGPSARTGEVRDDGDICILCADRRMEIFGDIFIGIHDYAPTFRDAPSHNFGTILTGGCPRGTACLNEGTYVWRGTPAIPWLFELEAPAQSLGNRGEITFVAVLNDYDTENGPDPYCVASGTLQPRNKSEWTRINETVVLTGGSNEASCRIEILVQGIP